MLQFTAVRRAARKLAPVLVACYTLSSAIPVCRAESSPPIPPAHRRVLSAGEMRGFIGTQSHVQTFDANSGPAMPWEGSFGDIASINGNKNTDIPLVSWTARGGMEVEFSLVHNNLSTHNSELGPKWCHSFEHFLMVDSQTGDVTIHYGNDGTCYFTKNVNGTYTPPAGIHDTLVANGNPITSYDLTTHDQTTLHFTKPNGNDWYCVTISDLNGNAISISYNSSNYITSISDPTSRSISLTYNGSNMITTITDSLSRQWSLSYNGSGQLSQITYPTVGGNSYNVQFGYDSQSNISSLTDKRSNVWSFSYDLFNQISGITNPLTHVSSLSYTSTTATFTDPNNHSVVHTYSSGNCVTVTDPLNKTDNYVFDSDRNRTQHTDRRGNVWNATFDTHGNCLTETDPLSHVQTRTFNTKNEVLTYSDGLSHQWSNTFDSAGNLTQESDPLGHSVSHTFNSYGLMLTTTDALSHTWTTAFDTNGNATSVTDPNTNVRSATFDDLGRMLTSTDGGSHTTTYTLDNWGRVTAVSIAGTTVATYGYDANSNRTTATDGNSNTTTTAFDALNRPTSVTNGNSDVLTYTWDGTGKKGFLASKTNGNNRTTSYGYTVRNERSSASYPDSTSESWAFDFNGNLSSHTNGKAQTINYTRDSANRLTLIDYPTGTDTGFSYDNADRRTGMTDSTGTTTWTFDNANRLTSIVQPNGTVTYGFDNADRRTSMALSGTGTWSYSFDNGNRLTSLTNPYSEVTSTSYNADDLPTQGTAGNSSVTLYAYDSLDRCTDVWHKTSGGATLGRYQYSYDSASNVTSRADNDGSTTSFGYNGANALTSESRSTPNSYSISYTYDHNQNRLTKTIGGVTDSYSYDYNDKLTSTSSKTFSYDNNGNCTAVTTGGNTTSLSYDYENRITGITYPNTSTNSFQYNGLNLRTRKVDSSGTINYLCDGTDPGSAVVADTNATYTGVLSERRSGVSKFYHGDALSSTRGITNSSQTATDGILYDAFGMTVSRTGTTPTPFGFVGGAQYQTDPDSGLMLLGNRYYDSSIGRFITQDPIGDGDNWYAYVDNNPLGGIDPLGLQAAQGRPRGKSQPEIGNKLPAERIISPPAKRGLAPIGDDGKPIDLHHRNQNPNGPIDEMTREDHRGKGNHAINHPNPNQGVKHDKDWDNFRRDKWARDWDSGRWGKQSGGRGTPGGSTPGYRGGGRGYGGGGGNYYDDRWGWRGGGGTSGPIGGGGFGGGGGDPRGNKWTPNM